MSARTEQLVERIKLLEEELTEGKLDLNTTVLKNNELRTLRKQLSTASEALTEGKQILKG